MINSLDPTRDEYRVQAVTPVDQVNPGAPIPGNPGVPVAEQGSPQLGPITTTSTPPTNMFPNTGSTTPSTGGGGHGAPAPPQYQQGLSGLVGLDFARQVTPNELVSNQLNELTRSNSPYMQNARRRGVEYANSRGNINSSIGGGSAMRAALEAGMPIAQANAAAYSNAGDRTFDAADRIRQEGVRSLLGQNDALFSAQAQDWLNNNTFNREFNGQLALMPIANAADMWSGLMNLATQNPEVFTPTVLAGYQDFFQTGFDEYISRYLGGGGP